MDFDCTQVLHDTFSESDTEEDVNKSSDSKEVAVLKVISGPTLPTLNYPLYIGKNVIGRGDNCNVCINSQALSKQHAIIEIDKKLRSCEIYDLGSSNKTRRGKIVLKPNVQYHLEDQDFVRMADIQFQFIIKKDEELDDDDSDTGSESMFVDDLKSYPLDDSKAKSDQSNLDLSSNSNLVLASSSDVDSPLKMNVTESKSTAVITETPAPSKTLSHLIVAESDKGSNDEDTDIDDSLLTLEKYTGNILPFANTAEEKKSPFNSSTSLTTSHNDANVQSNNEMEIEKLEPNFYEADTQPCDGLESTQPYIPTQNDQNERTDSGGFIQTSNVSDLNPAAFPHKNVNFSNDNEKEFKSLDNSASKNEKRMETIEEEFASTQLYVPSDSEDNVSECSDVRNLKKNETEDNSFTIEATQLYIPSPSAMENDSDEMDNEVKSAKDSEENIGAGEQENEIESTQLYVPTQETALAATQQYIPSQEDVAASELPTIPYSVCIEDDTSPNFPENNEKISKEEKNKRKRNLRNRKNKTEDEQVLQNVEEMSQPVNKCKDSSLNGESKDVLTETEEDTEKMGKETLENLSETDEKLSQNMYPVVVCTDVFQSPLKLSQECKEQDHSAMEKLSVSLPSDRSDEKSSPSSPSSIETHLKKSKQSPVKRKKKSTETPEELPLSELPTLPVGELLDAEEESHQTSSNGDVKRSSPKKQINNSSPKGSKHSNLSRNVLDKAPRTRRKVNSSKGVEILLPFHEDVTSSPVFNKRRSSRQTADSLNNSSSEINTMDLLNNSENNDVQSRNTTVNQHNTRRRLTTKKQLKNTENDSFEKADIANTSSKLEITDSNIHVKITNKEEITKSITGETSSFPTPNETQILATGNGALKVDPLVLVMNKSQLGDTVPYIIQKTRRTRKKAEATATIPATKNETNISLDASVMSEDSNKNFIEGSSVNNSSIVQKSSRKSKIPRKTTRGRTSEKKRKNEESPVEKIIETPESSPITLQSSRKSRQKGNALTLVKNRRKQVEDNFELSSSEENLNLEPLQNVRRSSRNSRKTNETENANNAVPIRSKELNTLSPKNSYAVKTPKSTNKSQSARKNPQRKKTQPVNEENIAIIEQIAVADKNNGEMAEPEPVKSNRHGRGRKGRKSEEHDRSVCTSNAEDSFEIYNQKEQTLSLRQYRKRYNSKEKALNTSESENFIPTEMDTTSVDVSETKKAKIVQKPNENTENEILDSISEERKESHKRGRKRSVTPTAKVPKTKRTPPPSESDKTVQSEMMEISDETTVAVSPKTPKSGRGRGRKKTINTPASTPSSLQSDNAALPQEVLSNSMKKKRGRKPKLSTSSVSPLPSRPSRTDNKSQENGTPEGLNKASDPAEAARKFAIFCANVIKPNVMFTGVVDEKAEKIVKELGGKISNSVSDCTHLITDKVRRTFKLLCHLARGRPIVTVDWIYQCKKKSEFVDASSFLVNDTAAEKQFGFNLKQSLEKAFERPLLKGFSIHVTGGVKPEPSQMKMIIECAGGEYLTRMPASNVANRKTIVVSCTEDLRNCSRALAGSVPVVSAEFILTGILKQSDNIESYCLIT